MKKLLALLLVLSIFSFTLISCTPIEPDGPGTGETGGGDGDGDDGPNIDPDGWTNS